jgi:protein TonB
MRWGRHLVCAAIIVGFAGLAGQSVSASKPTPPASDWGGAVPLNLRSWFSYEDYPDAAAIAGEEGYVTVAFAIGADGRMSDCQVTRSSGFKRLDDIPCKVLPKRARFKPALDANGAPMATRGSTSMSFYTR